MAPGVWYLEKQNIFIAMVKNIYWYGKKKTEYNTQNRMGTPLDVVFNTMVPGVWYLYGEQDFHAFDFYWKQMKKNLLEKKTLNPGIFFT